MRINPNVTQQKGIPHKQTEAHKNKLRDTCHKMRKCFHVGEMRKMKDGVIMIKVAMPDKWMKYNRYLWEQHYGAIPNGCLIVTKDGDNENIVIENLMVVSRSQYNIIVAKKNAHRNAEIIYKRLETQKANRRAALRQKYGSISMALAAGETL